MARPKSENPRSEIVKLRVTVGEKARIEAAAAAGGQAVADYVRGRVLDPRMEALRLLERTEVGQARVDTRRSATAASTDTDITPSATGAVTPRGASRPAPAEPPVLHRCPRFAGCGFQAPSAKARCPIHGCTVKA